MSQQLIAHTTPLVPYSITYTVKMDGTTGRFTLPDEDLLRGRRILGMGIRKQDSSDNAVSIEGDRLVSEAGARAAFIALVSDRVRVIDEQPVENFYSDVNRQYVGLKIFGFNPTQSYIYVADASNISDGEVFELTFIYEGVQ